MKSSRRAFLAGTSAIAVGATVVSRARADTPLRIASPMVPPNWALLQRELLRANADLSPALIARAIAKRLRRLGLLEAAGGDVAARVEGGLAVLDAKEAASRAGAGVDGAERTPWFCSGCPHNTSTRLPQGPCNSNPSTTTRRRSATP